MSTSENEQLDYGLVFERAVEMFGTPQRAWHWLGSEIVSLDGKRPIDLMPSARGLKRVLQTLGRIEHGVHG